LKIKKNETSEQQEQSPPQTKSLANEQMIMDESPVLIPVQSPQKKKKREVQVQMPVYEPPQPVTIDWGTPAGTAVESDENSPVVEEVRVPEVSRDTKVYFPSQANFDPSQFELPEEFYDMTPEDYARLIEEQSRKQKEMEIENSVLMTKQSRDYFKSKKQKKYKKCMLRIRFPDRTILEGTFHPLNRIRDVEDYVRQNLFMSDLPFYLYISPPVQKFTDTNATLRQSNLVPATVINFALKDGAINGDQDTFFFKKTGIT